MIAADRMPGPHQGHWTYSHYAALPDDGHHYEIVDGVLYMAPAPNLWHQEITLEIATHLRKLIKLTGLGKVYVSPVDVQLSPNTIMQPDVVVVLNEHADRLQGTRIVGAPDLVVEVASPATITYDRREKYDAYARAGVREYWLVDPGTKTIEIRVLEGSDYQLLGIFIGQATLQSHVIPGLEEAEEVHVEDIFASTNEG